MKPPGNSFSEVKLRTVTVETFPRSGHHLLERLMSSYWGDAFKYCETYRMDVLGNHNFIKSHDFKLEDKPNTEIVVVQYRACYPALCSMFQLDIKQGYKKGIKEEWDLFLPQKITFWKCFVRKWLQGYAADYYIPYDQLCINPARVMKTLIRMQAYDHQIDEAKLKEICGEAHPPRHPKDWDFRFYNPEEEAFVNELTHVEQSWMNLKWNHP